jgi:hypothetical protein
MTAAAHHDPSTRRIVRDTVIVCVMLGVVALAIWPRSYAAAGGVMAGGLLMAISAWAIQGAVNGLLARGGARASGRWLLVKFFTRHAILAAAAYGIMVCLHLDPVGMLVGVSSPVLAAGVEGIRRLQRVS